MTLLLEQILNGLQLGVTLFLMAAGLTLIFGIMGIINLAHGSLYMVGAYAGTAAAAATGSFWLAIPFALAAAALAGVAIEALVIRRLYRRDHVAGRTVDAEGQEYIARMPERADLFGKDCAKAFVYGDRGQCHCVRVKCDSRKPRSLTFESVLHLRGKIQCVGRGTAIAAAQHLSTAKQAGHYTFCRHRNGLSLGRCRLGIQFHTFGKQRGDAFDRIHGESLSCVCMAAQVSHANRCGSISRGSQVPKASRIN